MVGYMETDPYAMLRNVLIYWQFRCHQCFWAGQVGSKPKEQRHQSHLVTDCRVVSRSAKSVALSFPQLLPSYLRSTWQLKLIYPVQTTLKPTVRVPAQHLHKAVILGSAAIIFVRNTPANHSPQITSSNQNNNTSFYRDLKHACCVCR